MRPSKPNFPLSNTGIPSSPKGVQGETLQLWLDTFPAALKAVGIPDAEAISESRLLIMHGLSLTREDLWTKQEYVLSIEEREHLMELLARRARREPLAYILGTRGFYGLEFEVTPDVLIPRPETELLVDVALKHLQDSPTRIIADIGTGSGCVAIAIAANIAVVRVTALDVSMEALDVANRNVRRHNLADRISVYHDDGLSQKDFYFYPHALDLIVSNPPYIPPAIIETLEPEVRDYEPHLALDGGADGLDFYRMLARDAPSLLDEGGMLAAEVGRGQADTVAEMWRSAGLVTVVIHNDLSGIGRVVSGISLHDSTVTPT